MASQQDRSVKISAHIDTGQLESELIALKTRIEDFAASVEQRLRFKATIQGGSIPQAGPPPVPQSALPAYLGQGPGQATKLAGPTTVSQGNIAPSIFRQAHSVAQQMFPFLAAITGGALWSGSYSLGSRLAEQAGAVGMQTGGSNPNSVLNRFVSAGNKLGFSATQVSQATQLQGQYSGTGNVAFLFKDAMQTAQFARYLGISGQTAASIMGSYQLAGAFQPGNEASAASATGAAAQASGVNSQMYFSSLQQILQAVQRTSVYTPQAGPAQNLSMLQQIGNKLDIPLLKGSQAAGTLQAWQKAFTAGPGAGSGLTAAELIPGYQAVNHYLQPFFKRHHITSPVLQQAYTMNSNVLLSNPGALSAWLGAMTKEMQPGGLMAGQTGGVLFGGTSGGPNFQTLTLTDAMASPKFMKTLQQAQERIKAAHNAAAHHQTTFTGSIAQDAERIGQEMQKVLSVGFSPILSGGKAVSQVLGKFPAVTYGGLSALSLGSLFLTARTAKRLMAGRPGAPVETPTTVAGPEGGAPTAATETGATAAEGAGVTGVGILSRFGNLALKAYNIDPMLAAYTASQIVGGGNSADQYVYVHGKPVRWGSMTQAQKQAFHKHITAQNQQEAKSIGNFFGGVGNVIGSILWPGEWGLNAAHPVSAHGKTASEVVATHAALTHTALHLGATSGATKTFQDIANVGQSPGFRSFVDAFINPHAAYAATSAAMSGGSFGGFHAPTSGFGFSPSGGFSFTPTGVTTAAQKHFVSAMLPYAKKAAAALGVSATSILGQWGYESAFGTSEAAVLNKNFGGIGPNRGIGVGADSSYAGYSSLSQFEKNYVQVIKQKQYAAARNKMLSAYGFGYNLTTGGYDTTAPGTYAAGVQSDANVVSSIVQANNHKDRPSARHNLNHKRKAAQGGRYAIPHTFE